MNTWLSLLIESSKQKTYEITNLLPETEYTVSIDGTYNSIVEVWLTTLTMGENGIIETEVNQNNAVYVGDLENNKLTFTTQESHTALVIRTLGELELTTIQLEKGNLVTDWTPAPEEQEQRMSIIEQTAGEIRLEVSEVKGDVSSNTAQLSVQAGEISSKVSTNGVISAINQTAETIKIDASKINLTGYVTVSSLSGEGTTTIDGSNISTGVLKSNNGKTKIDLDSGTFLIGNSPSDYEMYYNGSTLALGGNTTISWANINNRPYIPTVPNYITPTKITQTTIESPTIRGGEITSDTTINVGTDANIGNNLYMGSSTSPSMKMIRFHNSASISSGGSVTTTSRIRVSAESFTVRDGDVELGHSEYPVTIYGDTICSNYTSSTYAMNLKPNNGTGGNTYSYGHLSPSESDKWQLGTTSYRWNALYISTGGINEGSDIRQKDNIEDIPYDLLKYFADEVKPKMFEVNGKTHFGYIAQDVERALYKYALDKVGFENAQEYVDEFNLLGKGESYLSLVYSQIAVVKEAEMQDRIDKLELQIEELKEKMLSLID